MKKPKAFIYWWLYLDEVDLAEYKTKSLFAGEENFETKFGIVRCYHMRKVSPYSTYNLFFDKSTGLLVYFKETYGGRGPIPNHIITYSMEVVETNFTPPILSALPYYFMLIGIFAAIMTAAVIGITLVIKRRGGLHRSKS